MSKKLFKRFSINYYSNPMRFIRFFGLMCGVFGFIAFTELTLILISMTFERVNMRFFYETLVTSFVLILLSTMIWRATGREY